jgi:serine/threonine protein kinase
MIKLESEHKRNSFHRERNGLRLKHPNIVSTISLFQGPKYGMVVMEKAPKTTLQQIILLNPMSDRLKLS